MFDLTGRNALVTGATGGIGGAIAEALHKQGATVTLSGTRTEALEQLKGSLGERAHVVAAKMDDAVDIDRLAKEAEAAMGKIDILVNNAGITRDNISMRMKDEEWEKVLQVNLTGTFRLTRAAMRGMMRRRHGRVINITSIVGVTGNPGQANYAAAKAGLIGMSKSLAQELASRAITVNCTPSSAALSVAPFSTAAQNGLPPPGPFIETRILTSLASIAGAAAAAGAAPAGAYLAAFSAVTSSVPVSMFSGMVSP